MRKAGVTLAILTIVAVFTVRAQDGRATIEAAATAMGATSLTSIQYSGTGMNASFGQAYRPAWDGHWSKMKITQLVTGRFNGTTRAFAFGLEHDPVLDVWVNQLYELTLNDKDDWDGPIQWELVSRAFDFTKLSQSGVPFTESELYDADLWLREIIE